MKHGMHGTKTYQVWKSMRERCLCKTSRAYNRYGGRGITICERWESFENFYADMGDRPEGKTIDRIDNDGPYSPENCRWATDIEQANNKRNNRLLTYKGKTQTVPQWARELGIKTGTIAVRLSRGLPIEKVLNPEKFSSYTETTKQAVIKYFAERRAKTTHCKNGHEFTLENTYMKKTSKNCRKCNAIQARADRARKRQS